MTNRRRYLQALLSAGSLQVATKIFEFITPYSKANFDPLLEVIDLYDAEKVNWKDNLGNDATGDKPLFDYSAATGDKTVSCYMTNVTDRIYNLNFIPDTANSADTVIKGAVDLSNIRYFRDILFGGNPITSVIFSTLVNDEPLRLYLHGAHITSLDLSKITRLKELHLGSNPNLNSLTFSTTQNNASIHLDLGNQPHGAGNGFIEQLATLDLTPFTGKVLSRFRIRRTALTSIDLSMFDSYSGAVTIQNGNVTTSVNISKYTGGSSLEIFSNSNLTSFVFPATATNHTTGFFYIYSNPQLTTLDLSWLKKSVTFSARTNALTSITFPSDGTEYTNIDVQENNLTTLDISGISVIKGMFRCFYNPNLSSITFPSVGSMDAVTRVDAYNCSLSNFVFPFGTLLKPTTIQIQSNAMDQATVDANIDNVYTNKSSFATSAKVFNCHGTNATPSGTYQAPAGYVQADATTVGNDGTPASAKEQIYVLVNQNNDNSTTKKYNWAITYTL